MLSQLLLIRSASRLIALLRFMPSDISGMARGWHGLRYQAIMRHAAHGAIADGT